MAAVPSIGRASLVEASAPAPQAAAAAGLYERHAAKILGYCLHQLGSREEAEDAVQTTFMNALRALGRGVVPESESAWLFKIAENVCLSRRRSSWRRGRIESPSDFEVLEEIIPGPSRQRDELIGIEDALASMPEQQRRAILLREWQGLSYREIAGELEVSQSAVETLIFRARRSLAQGLEQPDLQSKPKRKGFRRALHVVDLGTIVAAAKALFAGSAAVKATAAAVAVTAAAGTAAMAPELVRESPRPSAPVVVPVADATPVRPVATSAAPRAAEAARPTLPTALTPLQKAQKVKVAKAKTAKASGAAVPAARKPKATPPGAVEKRPKQRVVAERAQKPRAERPAPAKERERSSTRDTGTPNVKPAPALTAGSERAPKERGRGNEQRELAAAPVELTLSEPEAATDLLPEATKVQGPKK